MRARSGFTPRVPGVGPHRYECTLPDVWGLSGDLIVPRLRGRQRQDHPSTRLARIMGTSVGMIEARYAALLQTRSASGCGSGRRLNLSPAPKRVGCELALHVVSGLSPQPTNARCARGEELYGERIHCRASLLRKGLWMLS
jgi:hypothetical protein